MRSIDRRLAINRPLRALVFAVLFLTAGAGPAVADSYFGVAGGAFVPYKGQVGWSVLGEFGGPMWGSRHFRGSTEFEFRRYQAGPEDTVINEQVNIDSYNLRLLGRFIFAPKKFTPYIGGGGGMTVIDAEATAINRAEISFGLSVLGLVGIEAPIVRDRLTIYAETRFGYTWALTGQLQHVNQSGFDGFTGVGGLRFWF